MTTKKHEVPEELLSGLLANYKKPEDLIGENGLLKQLTKLLVESPRESRRLLNLRTAPQTTALGRKLALDRLGTSDSNQPVAALCGRAFDHLSRPLYQSSTQTI